MDNRKNTAVILQLGIALFLGGAIIWECTDFLKLILFQGAYEGISRWALAFYHPHESGLLNYLLFSLGLGAAGLAVYCRPWDGGIFSRIADGTRRSFVRLFSLLFLLALANAALRSNFGTGALFKLALIAVPLLWSLDYSLLGKRLPGAVTLIILLFLCLEPASVFIGPVRLINEYADLDEETLMDAGYVRNRDFAEYRARGISMEGEEEFLEKNLLELHHQAITRGQINHIGHVLNPINEYLAGKPLRDIYVQYGVGNTLLMKWTMDLLGGLSIQNYYKCYVYYIAYYVLFLLMLVCVFRDGTYVLGAFGALAASQFFFGYMSFILGPGLIPTIHFCDVFVLAALAGYLRDPERRAWLALAFLAAACGALLNRQFGGALAAALTITALFFFAENASGRARYALAGAVTAALLLLLAAAVRVYSLAGHGEVFGRFLSGYFASSPAPSIVLFTLLYLPATYAFLSLFRENRHPLKYLSIFSFLYAQGVFVYFYWCGLTLHLPMVTTFIALHIFLSLALAENKLRAEGGIPPAAFLRLKKAALITVLLCVPVAAGYFYRGNFSEKIFSQSFNAHRLYKWDFARAGLISTIDPRPLKASLSQITRYSGNEKGIYILSRYDNLIPFLAGKYSRFPVFDMTWYMLKADTGSKVAARLESDRPEYIYVDADFNDNKPDLWTLAYGDGENFLRRENKSRLGRILELKKIFLAVSPRYVLVERGPLLSVYRRLKEAAPGKGG